MSTNFIIDSIESSLRGARGISKVGNAEAASAVGCRPQHISTLLADPGNMKVRQLVDLSRVYKMDLSKAWASAVKGSRQDPRS